MSWVKSALPESMRNNRNMRRWEELRKKVQRLNEILFASQSSANAMLKDVLEEPLVQANEDLKQRLLYLLSGENNQKVILDSPHKAKEILDNALLYIDGRINGLRIEIQKQEMKKDDFLARI